MKKLYRKGTVHPSPSLSSPSPNSSPPPSSSCTELFSLSFLPAAILTLAAALTAEDRDVLAYLLSCSSSVSPFDYFLSPKPNHVNKKKSSNNNQQHPPSFNCYCFNCYTSYWAKWDSSPNRQLIHEIIDAFEDGLVKQGKKNNNNNSSKKHGISRREKRRNKSVSLNDADDCHQPRKNDDIGLVEFDKNDHDHGHDHDHDHDDETGEKEGSVKKIVSFIGERIWGSVWG